MKQINEIDDKTIEIDGKKYALIEEKDEEQKKELWEPRGGEWYVRSYGNANTSPTDTETRLFGNEFRTKEEAEWASKLDRIHKWFEQLRLDYCPEFEEDWKNSDQKKFGIYYNHVRKEWCYSIAYDAQTPGIIYFSPEAAKEIIKKLNNGEIVIPHFLSK